MNRIIILSLFLVFSSNLSFSQFRLEIEVSGIRNNDGNIMLQLFNSDKKVIAQEVGKVKDNKCTFLISNLQPAKYAVRYYHDENMNEKMETNLIGKPTEGYGFSNNVIGKFGPPPFEKWLFELKGDMKIVLKPTY